MASSGTTSEYGFGATSGYRNDGDAGLTHIAARYYDAAVGQFISRDTQLDQKPYQYCEHDPVNRVDPSGHIPVTWPYPYYSPPITPSGPYFDFGGWTRADWNDVWKGTEEWGYWETRIGGGGWTGGGIAQHVAAKATGGIMESVPVVRTIGGAVWIGGVISQGIGKIGQYFTQ